MTWRIPPYDLAVVSLEAYIRTNYAPRGILVSGSIVRHQADPNSDLDVFVIHDEPWRVREHKVFHGVPTALFVNPPAQVRRYFAVEHNSGRPVTAHMFATGEIVPPVDPIMTALVEEANEWLARPLEPSPAELDAQRHAAVDFIDDVRDIVATDPAAAHLLLAQAVNGIVAHAFWRKRRFQPRRKNAVHELAVIDPHAADLVRQWASESGEPALTVVEALARHVLGVDTFFEWISEREPVSTSEP